MSNTGKDWMDRFHAHLDICYQCREHPFSLCKEGAKILTNPPSGVTPFNPIKKATEENI